MAGIKKNVELPSDFWINNIEILKQYCKRKKWEVEFFKKKARHDQAIPAKSKIKIREDRSPEITFYVFLHEIGHMILCGRYEDYHEKYAAALTEFNCNSQTHRIICIEEELEAWRIGLKVAKRLDLFLNRRKFEEVKSRNITTYMLWALNRKIQKAVSDSVADHFVDFVNNLKKLEEKKESKETNNVNTPNRRNNNRKSNKRNNKRGK